MVCLVYLVCLVCLVSFVPSETPHQIDPIDQTDQIDEIEVSSQYLYDKLKVDAVILQIARRMRNVIERLSPVEFNPRALLRKKTPAYA